MALRAHLVITDSGLGGLAICAGIERALRELGLRPAPRLTYVNAWPDEGHGYNDLPDIAARAEVFDRALVALDAMVPDQVLIACNTLSIVYTHTAHARRAAVPVQGIVDAGVSLFEAAMREQPASGLVVIGTRTTVESEVHARALVERGVEAARVAGASCHGLATAIEAAPHGAEADALIANCAARAAAAAPAGHPLLIGLCCTHYGFVRERIEAAVVRCAARPVRALDPNDRMVEDVVAGLVATGQAGTGGEAAVLSVEVVSKVALAESKRRSIAEVIETVSPATALALRGYTHVPDLF